MQDDWVRKLGDRSSSVKRLDTSASASATEVRLGKEYYATTWIRYLA